MSTINHHVVASHLTVDRLRSYLTLSGADVAHAIALYDWNAELSGAFYEDIGRLEVVFRNALDRAMVRHGKERGWRTVWYRRRQLFPGKQSYRARQDIAAARSRARRRGPSEVHGKVIAELNFGFWRFLCTRLYLTSLWVPALAAAFPNHPKVGDPHAVRSAVDHRIQQLHFLRNRIAHHEPIHQRNLRRDHDFLLEVVGWISSDARDWIAATSRCSAVLVRRRDLMGAAAARRAAAES
jgi:hypothetical protein